ncbi:toxin Cry1Ac domain D-VI-related protein [Mesobacillus zeae]|uniref:Pesticidal crystal protein Cry1Aa domain-containing protein n=1 Tax=Mesobacillus zeae TaxID=1917180 RepID=A0A398BK47_9BACI|nr:toxin Cry1Ac domain D-VI-related protein [Mesobacillus zeae]RID88120.1 hypothetical protein D1970_04640 [Mesobacillus zeae]
MKKKKFWLITVIAVVGIGASSAIAYNQKVKADKQARIEAYQKQGATINKIQEKVNKLYRDKQKKLLAEGTSQEKIDAIKKDLEKQEGKKFNADLAAKLNTTLMDFGHVTNMVELQNLTKNLFDDKGAVVDNARFDEVDKKIVKLKEVKPQFVAVQQKIVDNAKLQVKKIEEATNKVNQLFAGADYKEVKSEVNRGEFNKVKNLVNEIRQEKAKRNLSTLINKVDQYLTEKEEAERIATEVQKQSQEAQSDTNSSSSGSHSNSSISNNNTGSSLPKSSGNNNYQNGSSPKTSSGRSSNNGRTSGNNTSHGTWTPPQDKPGTTWEGEETDKGQMDSDSGRTWGTIDW